nr:hypothetical protein [Tanacetum cinerariifolium]
SIFPSVEVSHLYHYAMFKPENIGFNEFSSNIVTAVAQQSPHHDASSLSHQTASTETIPTTIPTEIPTLRQYFRRATRIAQSKAFPTAADEPASLLRDVSQGEAFPTYATTTLRINGSFYPPAKAQTEMASKINAQDLEISNLKAMIKLLEDKDKGTINVPPAAEVPTVGGVPTVSGLVPIVSAIFTTASVVTPYSRRPRKISVKDKVAREMEEQIAREDQRLNEQIARDAEIAKIHVEEELKMMIDSLDRSNEMIAKHLHEYEQAASDLTIGEKIELINELVKYQDHHAKILKYRAQQSKPLSKKEQMEFYMSVLKSHSRWKTKHFRGMTSEEIKEKFIPVWKQIEDFVPMSSKEEAERFKRKGLRLEQGSTKKMKTSEEVSEEDLKQMMQLVPVEEVYVEALQVKHPIIDWEIHSK